MPNNLKSTNSISVTCQSLFAQNAQITKAKMDVAEIKKLINPDLSCLKKKFDSMFIQSDVSGCFVQDLSPYFKDLICDTITNWCPYYYCTDCDSSKQIRNLLNTDSSQDNSNVFFHEEIITNEDLSYEELSYEDSSNEDSSNDDLSIDNSNSNFISKNLSQEEFIVKNNLKIILIEKISKGCWLFNGNICIEIPKLTSVTNLKLFVYLDENVVSSGEIDLGSHSEINSITIKSHPFNLMFKNNINGRELKIGIISFDNKNAIKLLKTTNFFVNKM